MTIKDAVRALRKNEGFIVEAATGSWVVIGPSGLPSLPASRIELWASNAFMIEGYTGPLNEAAVQLMELAGNEMAFEFESWNQRMLPTVDGSLPLVFRIIHSPPLKEWIEHFRMPLIATLLESATPAEVERLKHLPLHPFKIEGFHPVLRPQRVRFNRDGSFKILQRKIGT